jgi:hypothetical protein
MLTHRGVIFLDLQPSLLISTILARIVAVVAFGTLKRNLIAGACLGHDASPIIVYFSSWLYQTEEYEDKAPKPARPYLRINST